MKKRSLLIGFAANLLVLSFSATTLAWFVFSKLRTQEDEAIDGAIGLRSYFYDGNGSEENPYEIVMPTHLYNMSRLQNLGIFQQRRFFFQLGHNFSTDPANPEYKCINHDAEGNTTYDDYLDMESFCNLSKVVAIGGEGSPFMGSFEGNDLTIKNLTVTGNPEDIGLFGYVSIEGSVKNTIVENITIESIGYDSGSPYDELFGAEVEDLFNTKGNNNIFSTADLSFSSNGSTVQLKNEQGLGGRTYLAVNSDENVTVDGDNVYYNGYFTPTFPTDDTFEYSWRFSTNILEFYTDSSGNEVGRINLARLRDLEEFNKGSQAEVDSRIYLIANKTIDGYTYSRVMQTYLCQFLSNSSSFDEGGYSMSIFCDYTGEGHTNYHHRNNIGYLAGHVDGSLDDCYVYNGTLKFNNINDKVHIATETETGLVGEIGVNVDNNIDPSMGVTVKGDTGVMNFSGIYNMVRDDYEVGDTVTSSFGFEESTRRSFFSYNDVRKEGYKNYKEYLRIDDSADVNYISMFSDKNLVTSNGQSVTVTDSLLSEVNTIDFIQNKVIQDTEDVDRGLGVFKVATGKDSGKTYQNRFLDKIGTSKIVNGSEITKIYYSTAEYDYTKYGAGTWADNITVTSPVDGYHYIETMDTLPEYADSRTFDPLYEKDFNYLLEMDLSRSTETGNNNFFYNIQSTFFQEYFMYKLIDKHGAKMKPNDQRFGFMLRASTGEIVESLSSYMPVTRPSAKFANVEEDGSTKYYPSSSITFRIENPNGANVAMVCSGDYNATIFSYDPTTSATTDITPVYAMWNKGTTATDSRPYFTYDPSDGACTSEATIPDTSELLKKGGNLFAHIFKLPQGDYCVGSDTADKSVNVFMLAVQGQTDGTIGDIDTPTIGSAYVNADFLLYVPDSEKKKAKMSFKADFNSNVGTFIVRGDHEYTEVNFNAGGGYVDYLYIHDRNETPKYYVNGGQIDVSEFTYGASGG